MKGRKAISDSVVQWLADVCRQNLLGPKWLVAPSLQTGHRWKELLCRHGGAAINLHVKTLASIAREAAEQTLSRQNLRQLSAANCEALTQQIIAVATEQRRLKYFAKLSRLDSLGSFFARSILDLKFAGFSPQQFADRAKTVGLLTDTNKFADLCDVFEHYEQALRDRRLVDSADTFQLASAGFAKCLKAFDAAQNGNQCPTILLVIAESHLPKRLGELIESMEQSAHLLRPANSKNTADGIDLSANRIRNRQASLSLQRAAGEANEVRGALQKIASQNLKLDQVEIFHTEASTYVPLIYEFFCEIDALDGRECEPRQSDQFPVTFATGIPCVYSRPGRALRAWLRWLRNDCAQVQLVQMIRGGLISNAQRSESEISFSRLANGLRRIPIGWRRDRYIPQLLRAKQEAERKAKSRESNAQSSAKKKVEASSRARSGQPSALEVHDCLNQLVAELLDVSPSPELSDSEVLQLARRFLQQLARTVNRLDRLSVSRLLDSIDGMLLSLQLAPDASIDVWRWLEDLPTHASVLQSGPRAGCVHVTSLQKPNTDFGTENSQIAATMRKHAIVLGLDDSRIPLNVRQDPLLLDAERRLVDVDLPTSETLSLQANQDFEALFAGEFDSLLLSFADRSLASDRQLFPSTSLLQIYARLSGTKTISIEELLAAAGPMVTFVSDQQDDPIWLNREEQTTSQILNAPSEGASIFLNAHRLWQHGSKAAEKIDAVDSVGEFDGYLPNAGSVFRSRILTNTAAADADKTQSWSVSASQLETFGTCPRRYFFRYGLGLREPDELIQDEYRWLDPLAMGSLLHSVFEEFLNELTNEERTPQLARDRLRLLELLQYRIGDARQDIPIPNQQAFARQVQEMEKTCEIFLRKEEDYCRDTGAVPYVMEANLGGARLTNTVLDSSEPIEVRLPSGKTFRASGIIDRVDRISEGGSSQFSIWDYKTGSSWGFDSGEPFSEGRKLQSTLYLSLLRHRLQQKQSGEPNVHYFGYFFPNPKAGGERIGWAADTLEPGLEIIDRFFESIANGVFLPTTNRADCKFCDYQTICGNPERVTSGICEKLNASSQKAFADYKSLRNADLSKGQA